MNSCKAGPEGRFRDVTDGFPHCIYVSSTMMRTAHILGMPIVVTEQYPEKLGRALFLSSTF